MGSVDHWVRLVLALGLIALVSAAMYQFSGGARAVEPIFLAPRR